MCIIIMNKKSDLLHHQFVGCSDGDKSGIVYRVIQTEGNFTHLAAILKWRKLYCIHYYSNLSCKSLLGLFEPI